MAQSHDGRSFSGTRVSALPLKASPDSEQEAGSSPGSLPAPLLCDLRGAGGGLLPPLGATVPPAR